MENFEPVDVDFIINSAEVKQEAAKVREEITGVAETAEKVTVRTSKKVKEELEKTSKKIKEETITATKETQKLNTELDRSAVNLGKQGQAAVKAKTQWNGLGNSINQLSRELPAFTYSAQTGFMALSNNIPILVDEIARLKVANAAAAASGAATIPVWKAIGAAIFSWGTLISLAITLVTVYGKEIGNFITGLFKTKSAIDDTVKAQEAMNKAFESSEVSGAIEELIDLKTNIDLAKKGLIDKKVVIDQYNEAIGQYTKLAKDMNDVDQGMIDNADNYIKATLYKAAAESSRKEAAERMIELMKEEQRIEEELTKSPENIKKASTYAGGGIGAPLISEKQIQIQLEKDLQKEKDKNLLLQDEELKKANKIDQFFKGKVSELKFDFNKPDPEDKTKTKIDKALDARQNLLDKIAAIDAEYARKSYTKDEEELQALRDKFGKVRELVERFNADPKNKAKRIDLTGLDETEGKALGDLRFRQETAVMAKEMSEQKRLFQEFEQYKIQFGEAKAKERFGKELKGYETYLDYLKDLKLKADVAVDVASLFGSGGGPENERADVLDQAATDEVMREEKKYNEILAANETFQTKMLKRTEEFNATYAKMLADGKYEEAEVYRERYEDEDKALKLANLKKTEAYKNLYSNFRKVTIQGIKELTKAMDEELAKTGETTEDYEELAKRYAELRRNLFSQISQMAGAIGALGQSLSELGSATNRSALTQIGNLMSGMASGVNDLLAALELGDDATDMERITAGVTGLVKMIDMLAGAAKQRRQAEEDYYRSVIGFQNDYNLSLNEQIRLQSILSESVFLKDFEGRMKDGVSAALDASKQYQEALNALNSAQVKSGLKNQVDWGNVGKGAGAGAAIGTAIVPVIGTAIGAVVGALAGFFGGKKKADTFLPLLQEYPDLLKQSEDGITRINRELAENLIQNNLVDEKTKGILENILEWDDALAEARKQIKDVVSELAGSLGSDMRNALVDAFRDGEDAAKAMGDTVEKVLENILSQLIFNRVFSKAFKDLEEEMVDSQDVGGDGNWVDDFERFFEASKGLSEQWDQAMKDAQAQAAASGFDIFKPEGAGSKPEGLTGGIMRLTEETGSEIAGIQRGTYDITKRNFVLNETRYALEQKRYEALIQMLMILGKIESNTSYTVLELQAAVVELKTIAKNTKSGNGTRDLGMDG